MPALDLRAPLSKDGLLPVPARPVNEAVPEQAWAAPGAGMGEGASAAPNIFGD